MIRTRKRYEAGLARFEELFGSMPGSPEAAELDRLAKDLDNYERRSARAYETAERWRYIAVGISSLLGGFAIGDVLFRVLF
jgi:hypothetical protein